MKKRVTVTIDEFVLQEAQKNIANLSQFVEDSLKAYLSIQLTEDLKEVELRQINDEIGMLHLKRFHLCEKTINTENNERRLSESKNKIWRKLFGHYKEYKTYDLNDIEKAEDLLGKSEEELVEMMKTLIENDYSSFDVKEWNGALEIYNNLNFW